MSDNAPPPLPELGIQWLERMREPLMILDEQWQLLFCNARLSQLSQGILATGVVLSDLPDSGLARELSRPWLEQAVERGEVHRVGWRPASEALRKLLPEAPPLYVEWVLYPLSYQGRPVLGIQICDVSDRLGQSLREREARLELLQQNRSDAETGLDNRASWEGRFATEFRRSLRYDEPLSMLLIAVDADPYPEGARPAVAREVASIVRAALRESDIAGRFERDLIAVALPHTAADGAGDVAQRLCERLGHLLIEWQGRELQGRTAIGVIQRRGNANTYLEMLQRCDDALYEARNGPENGFFMLS